MAFFFPTPRLTIRPWRERDRPDLERMATDLDMMRYVTGRAWPAAQIDEFLGRQQRHIRNHGVCFGAVELGDRMQVVGVAGMQPLDGADFKGDFELGWWIWKDFWGQGLAVEAVTPFVTHARNMGLERVLAVIDPPNSASIRVAEKLGMRYYRTVSARDTVATREDKPAAVYAMDLASAET